MKNLYRVYWSALAENNKASQIAVDVYADSTTEAIEIAGKSINDPENRFRYEDVEDVDV